MSLVNDMLRDLETRQREGATQYRAVPDKTSSSKRLLTLVLFILLAVALLVVLKPDLVKPLLDRLLPSTEEVPVNTPVASVAPNVEPEPVKVINQLKVINWTQLDPANGYITLWFDQVTPFTVLQKSPTGLMIQLDNMASIASLPAPLPSLLKQLEVKDATPNIALELVANEAVNFQPELKQNPPRLKINISLIKQAASNSEHVVVENNLSEPRQVVESADQPKVVDAPKVATSQDTTGSVAPVAGEWRKSINNLPTDATTVRNARRLLADSRTDEAIKLLQDFIDQTKQSFQSRYLLAQLFLATERYTQADQLFKQAPDNLSWALLRARGLLQQGQGKAAVGLLKRFPSGATREDYLELLAGAYQQAGQYSDAVTQYLSLLALNPQEARWWVNMGVALEYLGQQNRALDAYRSALKIPTIDVTTKQFAQRQTERLLQ